MRVRPRDCLPPELRDAELVRLPGGLSGASVHRVETKGHSYLLKLSPQAAAWTQHTSILRSAADAGLAPRVVHVDARRRAVLSEYVSGSSVVALVAAPATRRATLEALGALLRRVHALPIPPGATSKDPRALLEETWASLTGFPLPSWIGPAVRRALDAPPPPSARAPVLSHNDPNPSNLISDGARLLLLDWDSAGPNDPLFDLAAVAVFFRLDDAASAQLIAAHDQTPVAVLPARFTWLRGLLAALCGTLFLKVARAGGHPGGHDAVRSGRGVDARTPEGQWQFGQALLEASVKLFG